MHLDSLDWRKKKVRVRLDIACLCNTAKHNDNLFNFFFWSRSAGELLLSKSPAGWRIHPFISVTEESNATWAGLHGPPLYPMISKKETV